MKPFDDALNFQPRFDPLPPRIDPILPKPMYEREPLLPPPPSPVHNLQGGLVGYHDPMTNLIQPASLSSMPLQVDPGGCVRDAMGDPVGQMTAAGVMGPPAPITLG